MNRAREQITLVRFQGHHARSHPSGMSSLRMTWAGDQAGDPAANEFGGDGSRHNKVSDYSAVADRNAWEDCYVSSKPHVVAHDGRPVKMRLPMRTGDLPTLLAPDSRRRIWPRHIRMSVTAREYRFRTHE